MKVRLIAFTTFDVDAVNDMLTWEDEHIDGRNDADMLAEFAGRLCYISYGRANGKTKRNVDYIKNILNQQHYSVLEHASASFLLQGVSRTLTHELIRHRHFSYSQLSQRYVDEQFSVDIVPPLLRDATDPAARMLERSLRGLGNMAREIYNQIYEYAEAHGASRKEARSAARAALPAGTATSIVVTGNMRAWREFLSKRWSKAADQEIRELAGALFKHLENLAPATFQDIPAEPYGS